MEGSNHAGTPDRFNGTGFASAKNLIAVACVTFTIAILVAKFVLAVRLNVNWDEFYFLSQVYALERGDLSLFLQGAYTHAFTWITSTGGNEIDQIVRLRIFMCALLAASAGFVYSLARLWASRPAALIAVLAFLSTWPVLKHGASFRSDSLLLPLTLASFYFASRAIGSARRNAVIAGICIGLAFVVTVKAVLLLPALVLMAMLPDAARAGSTPVAIAGRVRSMALVIGVAALVALALLAWHSTYVLASTESAGTFVSRSLQATIFDMPFAPRRDYLLGLVGEDMLYWLALLGGLLVAVGNRSYAAVASVLVLAPVLFYRNAYPYYYPVMLGPPAILIAIAADQLLDASRTRARKPALLVVAVAGAILVTGAWDSLMTLRYSSQAKQRAVVNAVHHVFPQPIPYIDHSGMIASFPKVNFFMSTWGVEAYLRGDTDFMPVVLSGRCPPLLLVDHPVLVSGTLLFRRLRENDSRMLEDRYVDYWGPIRVAGAEAEFVPGVPMAMRVPCSGAYRIETDAPVILDGELHGNGSIVQLIGERDVLVETADPAPAWYRFRLVWADALEPPAEPPPELPLYDPL